MDTLVAIKTNAVTYVVSVAAAVVVSILTGALLITVVLAAAVSIPLASRTNPGAVIGVIVMVVALFTLWYAFSGAFMLSFTALALYAGAGGQKSTIPETMHEGFVRMKRVVVAGILVVAVALWPLIATIAAGFALYNSGGAAATPWPFLIGIAAIIWLYIALLRYALAPYVALFEPDVPVMKVLSRSKQLMLKGGQWFVVKGIGLIFLVSILLGMVSGSQLRVQSGSSNLVVNVVSIVITILANGSLVLLYRNRKMVRG